MTAEKTTAPAIHARPIYSFICFREWWKKLFRTLLLMFFSEGGHRLGEDCKRRSGGSILFVSFYVRMKECSSEDGIEKAFLCSELSSEYGFKNALTRSTDSATQSALSFHLS